MIVGLIGLAIGRGPHVEEAVRVDCDKRVRVVHRHVCEQMDDAVHCDCFTQSFFYGHVVTKKILYSTGTRFSRSAPQISMRVHCDCVHVENETLW